MADREERVLEGGCTCGEIRYRITCPPLVVHCCHCRWCQRETGTAFALNALIESDRVEVLRGTPELIVTPSQSGSGQKIIRCPTCRVALWSHYATAVRDKISFIRVGTLDDPDALPPDVHIFTASKQPWVALSGDVPVRDAYYRRSEIWSPDSRRRYEALVD